MVSMPVPPLSTSSPAPPNSASRSAPPPRLSLPLPPNSASLPLPPNSESLPPPPERPLLALLPMSRLSRLLPVPLILSMPASVSRSRNAPSVNEAAVDSTRSLPPKFPSLTMSDSLSTPNVSLPVPPIRLSAPSPPSNESLPIPPSIVSSAAPPSIMFATSLPRMLSAKREPMAFSMLKNLSNPGAPGAGPRSQPSLAPPSRRSIDTPDGSSKYVTPSLPAPPSNLSSPDMPENH